MIVTDQESRKMYCPAVGGKCMGEECMAWIEGRDYAYATDRGLEFAAQDAPKTGKGYCGMVRK